MAFLILEKLIIDIIFNHILETFDLITVIINFILIINKSKIVTVIL